MIDRSTIWIGKARVKLFREITKEIYEVESVNASGECVFPNTHTSTISPAVPIISGFGGFHPRQR